MWKPQSGRIINTGITGKGTLPDYWKYIRKALQESDITVPINIQYYIDMLADGRATVVENAGEING